MRAAALVLPLLCVTLTLAACREEGDIQISSLDFNGVEQVDKGALANALQTKKGSWIPWGRKRYFDRSAFEADLKRIEAFYLDRGFPDPVACLAFEPDKRPIAVGACTTFIRTGRVQRQ